MRLTAAHTQIRRKTPATVWGLLVWQRSASLSELVRLAVIAGLVVVTPEPNRRAVLARLVRVQTPHGLRQAVATPRQQIRRPRLLAVQ